MSAHGGRHDHFEEFYQRHQDELARLAFLVAGDQDEAADIAADALVAAWKNWDRVWASANPEAYVRRMVVNTAISRVRSRVRDRRRFLALIPRVAAAQIWSPDVELNQEIRAALLRLAPRRRACLVLRYAFDLSEQEVADTLEIAVGTVKSQTAKAAAQLRADLGSPAPPDPRPAAAVPVRRHLAVSGAVSVLRPEAAP